MQVQRGKVEGRSGSPDEELKGDQLTVGWKVSAINFSMASFRYRAVIPKVSLEKAGVEGRVFSVPSTAMLEGLDVLIIVKSFSPEDYHLAQEASRRGLPVVIDLCDNIFVEGYRKENQLPHSAFFHLMAELAAAIVVPTKPLADIVSRRIGNQCRVYVIPDGIDSKDVISQARRGMWRARGLDLIYRCRRKINGILELWLGRFRFALTIKDGRTFSLAALRFARRMALRVLKILYRIYDRLRTRARGVGKTIARSADDEHGDVDTVALPEPVEARKKILWFGNHGATHADFGMLDLNGIRNAIEKLAKEFPLELVVVSNNRDKFLKHIRPFCVASRYHEWTPQTMETHLGEADVVVVPNSLGPFSVCKSANRTVLALLHGKPVVAAATPALECLRGCVELDDFEGGLRRYLSSPEYARAHVSAAKAIIEREFGQCRLAEQWRSVLDYVRNDLGKGVNHGEQIVFVAQIPQDIELIRPIIAAVRQRGVTCTVWTSVSAMKKWPELTSWLVDNEENWSAKLDLPRTERERVFSRGTRVLVAVSETNLTPHRFANALARAANAEGLTTVTMQHGFENVGLTYTDDIHDIRRVRFSSNRIYIWGGEGTLHPEVLPETRRKCVSVGCPKSLSPGRQTNAVIPMNVGNPIVGVFENLHWHRYAEAYREAFVRDIGEVVTMYPAITFIVKPHNAGVWLTSRSGIKLMEAENLIVADPRTDRWKGVTAGDLLSMLTAVITTPSTVALDAALLGVPTAVVSYGMALDNYQPLPLLNGRDDWFRFLSDVIEPTTRAAYRRLSKDFVDKSIVPGDAVGRIADDLVKEAVAN